MSIDKEKSQPNIGDFSYTNTSIEDYFSDKFANQLVFNKQILTEISNGGVKLCPTERKLGFPKPDKNVHIPSILKPLHLVIPPLPFFNLFYHELDYIIENKSRPFTIVPRISNIRIINIDKIYFYDKLIQALRSFNDPQLNFIAIEINNQYNIEFDRHIGKINNAKNTAEKTIRFYNNLLDAIGNVKEKLTMLLEYKNFKSPLHHDADIDSYIRETWLSPQIEHWQELLRNGINEVPEIITPDLQELVDILNDLEPTKQADTHLANRESTNSNEIKNNKIPARYYALYHWLLIEMGIKSHFERDRNDRCNRKEIERYAQHEYPETNPQGFYRAFKEIDLTNKKAIANNYGHGYKEKIITISNNNAKIIEHLKNYPN